MYSTNCFILVTFFGITYGSVLLDNNKDILRQIPPVYKKVTTPFKTWPVARTEPVKFSFQEACDYGAYYCMRSHDTGKLCAMTNYRIYHDFPNYCMMDYVNCMERYEVWTVIHMGECFVPKRLEEFSFERRKNDYFLDKRYYMYDIDILKDT